MRSIKALSKDENNNIEYSYNANGVRTSKEVTINGITTNVEYVLNGTNIIEETRTTGSVIETLQYHYDSNNSIIGFTYNGEKYLYLKNIQNDIIGIIDENNNLVVEYNYDGYGNIISMVDNTTNKIGEKNPYRYRSYYYDTETSWYYLNSRYYNPNIGRFITMDEIEYLGATSTILSYNLFTYCEGNPISLKDPNGTDAIYVVDYKFNRGLPVVGHAILYFEVDKGVWYKTHFSGPIKNKKAATIKFEKIGSLSSVCANIDKKCQMFYIEGEYSMVKDVAERLSKDIVDKFYGGYNLFSNNCLHYVKDMLRLGRAYNPLVSYYIKNSFTIIPRDFYGNLWRANVLSYVSKLNFITKKILDRLG